MRPPRILVVDDEQGMREVCADALAQLARGVEVVAEGDAQAAAERLGRESFDVLVTDIRMPGMTGVELLRTARERDPDLPVLMITGFPSVETAVECLKLGAVDHLTKPSTAGRSPRTCWRASSSAMRRARSPAPADAAWG